MDGLYIIPRHLDDPPSLFFWQADTVMLVVVCFVLGTLLGVPLVATLLGMAAARYWSRIRESGTRGILTALLYWYGPIWLTDRPPSHVREYTG